MLLLPKAQGSIPGQGAKILQAEWHGQKRERERLRGYLAPTSPYIDEKTYLPRQAWHIG